MGKYYIEECKCGVGKGGFACGPIEGSINAAVKYTVDGVTKWIINSELMGLPSFYLSDESLFERFMENNIDEEFILFLESKQADNFEGIKLSGDYDLIVKSLKENNDNPASGLIRFVIALTRCDMDEIEKLINIATNHYAEEIEFPMSDVEEMQEWE